jgi:mRNA interferase MazF
MRVYDAGDIAWADLDPVEGTEQAGRRPALILSTRAYHEVSPRALICPITSVAHDWPSNVPLPAGMKIKGLVLVDQIRAIDRTRLFRIVERSPNDVVAEVRIKLAALLGIGVPVPPAIAAGLQ